MEQELWFRWREQERVVASMPRCEPARLRAKSTPWERLRRIVGRRVVHVGELIAAERYVPATR